MLLPTLFVKRPWLFINTSWLSPSLILALPLLLFSLPSRGGEIVESQAKFIHINKVKQTNIGTVNRLYQDKKGFIWLATDAGLHRFDGSDIKSFNAQPNQPNTLSNDIVYDMVEDENEVLWIATYGGGLNRLDLSSQSFSSFHHQAQNPTVISDDHLIRTIIDKDKNLWLSTITGVESYHPEQGISAKSSALTAQTLLPSQAKVWDIYQASSGKIWLATLEQGLYIFNPVDQSLEQLTKDDGLIHNRVRTIMEDHQGKLWIGTDGGVSVYQPKTAEFTNYHHQLDDPTSLSSNDINVIFQDDQQRIWLGTYGQGLNRYQPETDGFIRLNEDKNNPFSASLVNDIMQDKHGTLWFATENGLFQLNPLASRFAHLYNTTNNHFFVATVFSDSNNNLWIGTSSGVFLYDQASAQYQLILAELLDASSITQDQQNHIWIASESQGAVKLDLNGQEIDRLSFDNDRLPNNMFSKVLTDEQGTVWLGAIRTKDNNGGIVRLTDDQSSAHFAGQWTVYDLIQLNENQLLLAINHQGLALFNKKTLKATQIEAQHDPMPHVVVLFKDSQKRIWLGANSTGLWSFELGQQKLQRHPKITATAVFGIVEDQQGLLWITTSDGLFSYQPETKVVNRFDSTHGLHNSGFPLKAALAVKQQGQNKIYLGTYNGLTHFDADTISLGSGQSTPVLTDFKVANKTVQISPNGHSPLRREINFTEQLTLTHQDYLFSFTFSGLNFIRADNSQYAYKMEGLDKDWLYTDNDNTVATYTTLSAGDYTFKLKSSNGDGIWASHEKALNITILPPLWHTWQAYLLYVLALLGGLTFFIHHRSKALQQKADELTLGIEQKTQTIRQLLEQKHQLFANISHEFRTPLTLILSPVEQLRQSGRYEQDQQQLSLIKRNGLRLLRMVDQLLALAKLNSSQGIDLQPISLTETVEFVVSSFQPLAHNKHINLEVDPFEDIQLTLLPDSLEQCLSNLLSNAIKYTAKNGQIQLSVHYLDKQVEIVVADNGVGIDAKYHPLVFERFFRVENVQLAHHSQQNIIGAGIGLSLVKELVAANQGTIELDSEPNKGCRFTLRLPSDATHQEVIPSPQPSTGLELEVQMALDNLAETPSDSPATELAVNTASQSILIIEDNTDMRTFLTEAFSDEFTCHGAADGETGLAMALAQMPDLIICDVMMPGISGYEVAKRLREHQTTSHIPILMLTAKGDLASRMQGWQHHVDEYIAKPFDLEEVKLRVTNLLSIRQLLRQRWGRQLSQASPVDSPQYSEVTDKDKLFIERFESIIAEHYHLSEFNRAAVAQMMALGERQLNRKLSALIDHNFSEYLRKYRLRQAVALLGQGSQVAQIGDAVGFSSTSYFSTCFKAEFGQTVTQYEAQLHQTAMAATKADQSAT